MYVCVWKYVIQTKIPIYIENNSKQERIKDRIVNYSMLYTMDMISSFCGTCLLSGGTTVNPKNMKTRIKSVRSGLLRLKQTKTFSQSSLSSANSSRETKLSREPSRNTVVGMSTYRIPLTSSVFHSTSFSSLRAHLKLTNSESGLSAISSKSTNSGS